MNILVANDDGINAVGIRRLVEALSTMGKVYVFSPLGQRSAFSHALTTGKSFKLIKQDFPNAEMAYGVDGTPADCVRGGINILKEQNIPIHMVYTGINHGGNLGSDTVYSGTVSAAYEGMVAGIPSVAVSVESHKAEEFDYACELALKAADFAMGLKGKRALVNINTPNLPKEKIKGVKVGRLDFVEYSEEYKIELDEDGNIEYTHSDSYDVDPRWHEEADVIAIKEGYATMGVMAYDLNDYEGSEALRRWMKENDF